MPEELPRLRDPAPLLVDVGGVSAETAKMMLHALLTIEFGGIDSPRCSECRAKNPNEPPPEPPPPAPTPSNPMVIATPAVRQPSLAVHRRLTATGHHSDVECLVDAALNAAGFTTKEQRQSARQRILGGVGENP